MNHRNPCSKCRHYDLKCRWCRVLAKRLPPDSPACDYGILCIRSDRVMRGTGNLNSEYGIRNHAPRLKGAKLT